MEIDKLLKVEVAYADKDSQRIIEVMVHPGCTIEAAIDRSGIIEFFPDIDLSLQKVGIFGKIKKLSDTVSGGERIEIYRNLTIHPMELRRKKAELTIKPKPKQPNRKKPE